MRNRIGIAALLLTAAPWPAPAQQIDMAAIQKWSAVKVVHYAVDARFEAWTQVAGGKGGESAQGKVGDAYALEFDWDVRARQLAGPVTIRNGKSVVTDTRDRGECAKPVLQGDYEHFDAAEAKATQPDLLELKGARRFPGAQIANECPASRALHAVAAEQRAVVENIPIPAPKMMSLAGMGVTGNPKVSFTPDRQSLVMRLDNGWTLTYTPTALK